jgi:hypothetical protein
MTIRKSCISAAAFSALMLAVNLVGAQAGEISAIQEIKPIQGISFNAGNKHGVGYFYAEAGRCKLVLTLAEEPIWDDQQGFSVERHESSVPASGFTRYTSEGHSFEFGCQAGARAMTFKSLSKVATAD